MEPYLTRFQFARALPVGDYEPTPAIDPAKERIAGGKWNLEPHRHAGAGRGKREVMPP
jgi:hypothetical protein